ncbi:fasciclin domain-containing protein [Pengzhenrongella frigida]|uniref:Fasciclin domain-containing protein n=2 Tax=Pengzhenrongella frigida TaxID=1259133 RepID=A0A4Q5MXA8_9MICO|nr:fasciclin domain-containing protein [Cellulomonas sp. HLT2-17]
MRRQFSLVAVLSLALATTAACSSTDTAEPATSAATTVETPMEAASPDAMTEKDVVDTAVAAGDFTTLATALTAAGLVDTLKGEGPFTVFAPTDEAFAALPAGTLDALLADPTGDLTSILTYHVVPGKVMAADVLALDGQKVATVNGAEITVNVDGSTVSLTDAKGNTVNVTQTDIEASNGVIHVIDAVLMP